ncbi:phosphogluconate dehydrogenase (NAD(+)-dependent, decarboxylating) [Nonomuraea sp. NPDC050540]|uniref:phosphogluconate dehydrogenase (NAD(+)-dependent, decarboxylating) n=1 Tax=Nonomuraea sp. NPDC050540 TaxID=3364367 RepID=UPI003796707C
MKIAMVGLGRMGANMTRRIMRAGHECVVFDHAPAAVQALAAEGAQGTASIEDLVRALPAPRVVWLMLPAAVTGQAAQTLFGLLEPGDVVIDGGNSYYRDDVDRARAAGARGIHYVDVGTSGGVWGLDRGYCLMVGGDDEAVKLVEPVLVALAPGADAAGRTPGRTGEPSPAELGWLHCGPPGAGHFVKMVHNGIEYAIMAAYAEGLSVLGGAGAGRHVREADAETAPLREPQYYQYDGIDLAEVAEVWRRGSVIGSWLLDLTAAALHADPDLERFAGRVSDSGEGRWTSIAAIEEGVPSPVLTAALYSRFASQGAALFAGKVQSAQRKGFGGHDEKDEVRPG